MKEPWQDGDAESLPPAIPDMPDFAGMIKEFGGVMEKIKRAVPVRPLFPMRIDDSDCVVRDDGAVFFYSASMGGWIEHSQIPGTPAARPKDDDAAEA